MGVLPHAGGAGGAPECGAVYVERGAGGGGHGRDDRGRTGRLRGRGVEAGEPAGVVAYVGGGGGGDGRAGPECGGEVGVADKASSSAVVASGNRRMRRVRVSIS